MGAAGIVIVTGMITTTTATSFFSLGGPLIPWFQTDYYRDRDRD